jgi:hypothetical protein
MEHNNSNAALFEIAIGAEQAGMSLYLGLVQRFLHVPEIAGFWQDMLEDEITHAKELERVRHSLKPDLLQVPADPVLLQKASEACDCTILDKLESVADLDDAYQLANEFEHSEVNTVFAALMTDFTGQDDKARFASNELQLHLAKLVDFPSKFGDAGKRRIVAVRGPICRVPAWPVEMIPKRL